jgi:hypothetical protein
LLSRPPLHLLEREATAMFDTIGRDTDDEAVSRRAKAVLLTLLGVGGVCGLVVGVSAYLAARTLLDDALVPDERMVELLEPLDPSLGAPPPPPPPAGRADGAESEPDEPPEVVPPLEDPVSAPLVDEATPQGTDDGVDGGDPDGVAGGLPGGQPGGFPGATGTGLVSFHHTELSVKRRVFPGYPDAALALSLGEQRCLADVSLDERGTPFDVTVTGCPAVFDGPTREALYQWRWYPPRVGSRAVQARTRIAVTYATK